MSIISSLCCLLSIATMIAAYPKIEHRSDGGYGGSSGSGASSPASGFQQIQSQLSQFGGNIPGGGIPNASQYDYRQCFEQVTGQSSPSGSSSSSSSFPSYQAPSPDQFQKIQECLVKKTQQQQSSSGSSN